MRNYSPDTNREHEWVQDHLPPFVNPADDSLNGEQEQRVSSHLGKCASCANYEQLLRTMYADQTAKERRSILPHIHPDRLGNWDQLLRRKDGKILSETTTTNRSAFWAVAAMWLVAGLIAGGVVTNQWTAVIMESVGTESVMNESDAYWSSFQQAVNQQWIDSQVDWNRNGETLPQNTPEKE
ncbi:MAG: hypothetical protein ACQETE_03265 [Bacteroidota bacterium]